MALQSKEFNMAIVCNSTITGIDIPNKIVRISANISVDDGPVHTVTMSKADISMPEKKAKCTGIIWAKFLIKHARQLEVDSVAQELTDLRDDLNANIAGRII